MTHQATTSIDAVPGIGQKLKEKFQKLGIATLEDALFHLPARYQDRTRVTPIRILRDGDEVVVEGHIVRQQLLQTPRRMLRIDIHDGTGVLGLRFFNFHPQQLKQLKVGLLIRCFGHIRRVGRQLEMMHPEYFLGTETQLPLPDNTLTPIYPLTEGLSQQVMRRSLQNILTRLGEDHLLPDYIPADWVMRLGLPSLDEAIRFCHAPPPNTSLEALLTQRHPAQQRLAMEELLAHELQSRQTKANDRAHQAPVLQDAQGIGTALLNELPFTLTAAQQRVLAEIRDDLQKGVPMMRLLQGDVGCGKTAVAALAMAQAAGSGFQAALMAPTELLAEQQARTLSAWFEPLGIRVALLTSQRPAKEKKATYAALASGEIALAVGTHALVQEGVSFHALGLVITDEQHRFGVDQRLLLLQKGARNNQLPHQLLMTATPIPRTLAMTQWAHLDVSVIDQLPAGRQPITTVAISQARRNEVIERVKAACLSGQQAYWVCTLIDSSEQIEAQAAQALCEALQNEMPEIPMGLIHGRLPPAEKEVVMQQFVQGNLPLLIATTVIEVGVNVPNASLMIIENPERLGLSQLHQLRGRVGRGNQAAYCVLLYQSPLSHTAKMRLETLRSTQDGFVIAEKDLALRGPGEWLGTRQTGLPGYRIADLVRDQALIPAVKALADTLLTHYPERAHALLKRWIQTQPDAYAHV